MLESFNWGKNLKNMGLISKVIKPDYIPSKEDIYGIRISVDNFPIFTKIDPPEVLEYYLERCNKDGIYPMVDPFNLPETYQMFMERGRKRFMEKDLLDRRIRRRRHMCFWMKMRCLSMSSRRQ